MRSAAPESAPQPVWHRAGASRWVLLALLVVSICLNYIDRGSVSVASKGIADELQLGPRDLGKLFSAFFWTYASFQLVAAWAIDRFNVYKAYGICFVAWSLATAMTGAAAGFAVIFMLRLFLGMAESIAYPAYSKIIAATFAEKERGKANSFIDAGSKLGPMLGTLVGGTIAAHYGWRAMFYVLGGASLLWLVPWNRLAPRSFTRHADDAGPSVSLAAVLSRREAWGTYLGLAFANWNWYFMLTWLPQYFVRERHFSEQLMATYGAVPYAAVAVASAMGGIVSDALIARGASPTKVRKRFVVTGLLSSSIIFAAVMVKSPHEAVLLLSLAAAAFGCFSSNHWAITQTLAGPDAAGKWTAVQNTFGNLAGIAAPYATGWIVAETGEFYWAFALAAVMAVIGALSYILLVPQVRPVPWSEQEMGRARPGRV
jgi:MFS family permease